MSRIAQFLDTLLHTQWHTVGCSARVWEMRDDSVQSAAWDRHFCLPHRVITFSFQPWREAVTHGVFGAGAGFYEMEQVLGAAGFAADAG
jgi:hypothetical protein